MYAKLTGKTPFVIYQGAWNVMQRDFERDIIPMAREEGEHAFLCELFTRLHYRCKAWPLRHGMSWRAVVFGLIKRKRSVARLGRKVRARDL